MIGPFLPETAARMADMLGYEKDSPAWQEALSPACNAPEWGGFYPPGHVVAKPEALFPRLETDGKA